MKFHIRTIFATIGKNYALFAVMTAALVAIACAYGVSFAQDTVEGRLVTVYDRGSKSAFLTKARTIGDALQNARIELDPRDTVEPALTEELVAPEYKVNIYRARPVVVTDGLRRTKVMTPYQTAQRIAAGAGIFLYAQDQAVMSRSNNLTGDGAGLQMVISRAIPFTLDLYGRKNATRTQAKTVGGMLNEMGISLGAKDRVSMALTTAIVQGMEVRVWREGTQTITGDEPMPFTVEQIYDADRPLGYKAVQTVGVAGIRTITYEVEIKDGQEISRKRIAEIVSKEPIKQIIVVGIQGMGQGLTKSKGAQQFTDSKGVTHRETYYDLDMTRVMQSCGQGGVYSVRVDGVKIDADGFVIIAANYNRYPKCSQVETSVGPAKVYDTGGFAAVHPDGFDIATDWSNNNGK